MGTVPNNNNARTRRSIELQITILRDHQLEPVKYSLPRPLTMILRHWQREHPAVEDLFERSFLAHNLDNCRDRASLPASLSLTPLDSRSPRKTQSQFLEIGFHVMHVRVKCVMLDFSVSFYAIASIRFLQAERFPKLGVQCLFGEHQTRIPFFCLLRRRQTSVLLDVIFANNFCVSIILSVSSKSTLGLLVPQR